MSFVVGDLSISTLPQAVIAAARRFDKASAIAVGEARLSFAQLEQGVVQGAAALIEAELRVKEAREIIFPHPTVGEVIRDALWEFH